MCPYFTSFSLCYPIPPTAWRVLILQHRYVLSTKLKPLMGKKMDPQLQGSNQHVYLTPPGSLDPVYCFPATRSQMASNITTANQIALISQHGTWKREAVDGMKTARYVFIKKNCRRVRPSIEPSTCNHRQTTCQQPSLAAVRFWSCPTHFASEHVIRGNRSINLNEAAIVRSKNPVPAFLQLIKTTVQASIREKSICFLP